MYPVALPNFSTLIFSRSILITQILTIGTAARNACVTGDLHTAEELLTREIDADAKDYSSYANRSFVMARKLDWDHALHDALMVRYTGPDHPLEIG